MDKASGQRWIWYLLSPFIVTTVFLALIGVALQSSDQLRDLKSGTPTATRLRTSEARADQTEAEHAASKSELHDFLNSHSDVATAVYAAVGVVYGVILAQVFVAAWSAYEDARTASSREAAALEDLIRLSGGFESSERVDILLVAREYANTVFGHEQKSMMKGEATGRESRQILDKFFETYAEINRANPENSNFLSASLEELDELGDAREDRLNAVKERMPDFLWCVLLLGGVLVVLFPLLYDVENVLAHAVVVLILILTEVLFLTAVWVWDRPFQGPARVNLERFSRVAHLADQELGKLPAVVFL